MYYFDKYKKSYKSVWLQINSYHVSVKSNLLSFGLAFVVGVSTFVNTQRQIAVCYISAELVNISVVSMLTSFYSIC